MHLIYIDDSGDEELCVFSALMIRADKWNSCLNEIKKIRHDIQMSDGISVYAEFHAWKFVSGRGKIADDVVTKGRRCQIFKQTLQTVATLPEARLFNTVFPTKASVHAYEVLLGSINQNLQRQDSHAILICDEGKETIYTKLVRRLQTSNNGAIDRILEDPFLNNPINHISSSYPIFVLMRCFVKNAQLSPKRDTGLTNHSIC